MGTKIDGRLVEGAELEVRIKTDVSEWTGQIRITDITRVMVPLVNYEEVATGRRNWTYLQRMTALDS